MSSNITLVVLLTFGNLPKALCFQQTLSTFPWQLQITVDRKEILLFTWSFSIWQPTTRCGGTTFLQVRCCHGRSFRKYTVCISAF
uniref:Secreted protein n=1 Tax=Octopus bimaculoides TaxID=37653 RepID=A0A0L8I7E2_OCTBM